MPAFFRAEYEKLLYALTEHYPEIVPQTPKVFKTPYSSSQNPGRCAPKKPGLD